VGYGADWQGVVGWLSGLPLTVTAPFLPYSFTHSEIWGLSLSSVDKSSIFFMEVSYSLRWVLNKKQKLLPFLVVIVAVSFLGRRIGFTSSLPLFREVLFVFLLLIMIWGGLVYLFKKKRG